MRYPVLILHASGTNRDAETARACELAGGAPQIAHINQLRSGQFRLSEFEMLVLPGGFSYGDALGAGVRQALDLRVFLNQQLQEYVAAGRRVLGICNGFQTLVKAGLLPGRTAGSGPSPARKEASVAEREVTLTHNRNGMFECRWVHLAVEPGARAQYLECIAEPIFCPVAHAEGNVQVAHSKALERLEREGLIAFRYVDADGSPAAGRYPLNPNGSVADIAGICNSAGNVVGLMPHPEDHIVPLQNPLGGKGSLGLSLFRSMIGNGTG